MSIQITPEASGVWRLRASLTKKATRSKDDKLFIPSFDTGKTYTSQFIAVGIRVNDSKDSWRFGGYLSQEYRFNSSGYTHPNKAFNKTQDLLINEISILNLPLLADGKYKLRYFPPIYFTECRIQIWEYIGVQTDLLLRDLANFFRNAPPDLLVNLPLIEQKLDLLLANQQTGIAVDMTAIEAKLDAICQRLEIETPNLDTDYKNKFFLVN